MHRAKRVLINQASVLAAMMCRALEVVFGQSVESVSSPGEIF
jgi:hypothetical protein